MPIEYLMWAPLVCTSVVLYITLALGALFSVANSSWVSGSSRWFWAAVVILLPIAGAVLWLAASHRYNTAHRDDGGTGAQPQTEAGAAGTGDTGGTSGPAGTRGPDSTGANGTAAAAENSGPLPSVRRVRRGGGI
ncbi:PLD nuclease N-terminal domain-containing protein [Arthrobacter citreus]|uniref:PLD nuclease N-terminal domain-containing protein n=1 Tax=Arthrobacter TaxID=1663 RepID=UPI001264407D